MTPPSTTRQTAGHTPGPWTWERDHSTPFVSALVGVDLHDKAYGYSVAEIRSGDRTEADAALIAAAPQMLNALRAVLDPCPMSPDGIEALRAQVRAAIASATGAHP